jgi:hypothetical protein
VADLRVHVDDPGMATTYFTFQTSRGPSGLARRRRTANADLIERVDRNGEWVEEPELFRYIANPGTSFFEGVDDEQAEELADRYGVELSAP